MSLASITAIANDTQADADPVDTNFDNLVSAINAVKAVESQTSGEAWSAYDLLYLKVSDGRWYKAIATAITTLAQGMATAAAAGAGETTHTIFLCDTITNAGWSWAADPTRPLYLSRATAGALVQPASGALPSTTAGERSQPVAIPLTATKIYFNPGVGLALATLFENDEIEAIRGITATTAELDYLAGVTPGTAAASKVAILGANKNLDTLVLAASGLYIGAGAGTAMAATAAELNFNAGVTAGTSAASKTVVLSATSKINALDITTLTLNGTAITATAAEINAAAKYSMWLPIVADAQLSQGTSGATLAITRAAVCTYGIFVNGSGTVANYKIHWTFRVPDGFVSLTEASILYLTNQAAVVLRWNVDTSIAGTGEAEATDSIASTDTTTPATGDRFAELDISAALTGLAGGDFVGVEFEHEFGHANDTTDVSLIFGLLLRWS